MECPMAFTEGKCTGQKLVDDHPFPLVLLPGRPEANDVSTLVQNILQNKDWFDGQLLHCSAVLFRNYVVKNAADFNQVVEALGGEDIRYIGPAPRTHVLGRVWTANEAPLPEFIYFHHEMVLINEFPSRVMLFCEIEPPEGGETPFVASYKVTERMEKQFPEAVKEMQEKGLRYTLTVASKSDRSCVRGRGWEDAFGTSDKFLAEKRAAALGMELKWLPDGAVQTILGPRPVIRTFDGYDGQRRMWFNTIVGMHGKGQSSATMDDGTEIADEVVKGCAAIIEEESTQFPWQKGDILVLDNHAVLHGRRPSKPPRKILVSISK